MLRRGIRRALDLCVAVKLSIHLGLEDIRADEFHAMLILEARSAGAGGAAERQKVIQAYAAWWIGSWCKRMTWSALKGAIAYVRPSSSQNSTS